MTRPFSRRAFFGTSLLAATGFAAVACAPEKPKPTPTPTPTPTTRPGTSTRRGVSSSYGPNGTHFPAEVPWPGEVAALEIDARCDWVDIARRVQTLSAEEVMAGVVIRVAPGTLSGGGWTSSAAPALAQVGNQTWGRNVLIVPRDGFGTVQIADAGARFDQCARLSFFGFESAGGFALTRCVDFQVGWGRFDGMSITRGGRNLALYELVLGFRRNADDTSAVRPTETFEMTNLSRHGCVTGPSIKPEGSDAHCDTIQLEGTGTGAFGPIITVDCVDYGSSNATELLQDKLQRAEYHHSLILGGQLPWRIFPLQPGDYQGDPNAFAGGCPDVRLYDSVVSGAIGRMGFTDVQNTRISYGPVDAQYPASGTWTVDTGVADWSAADIMGVQTVGDYERSTLQALWAW
ncbi:MAG: hypothetical protein ABWY37_00140 [Microbacterium pygmaeum]